MTCPYNHPPGTMCPACAPRDMNASIKKAWEEWTEKTQWVQDEMNNGTLSPRYLGKHRADVMREEIIRLRMLVLRYAK